MIGVNKVGGELPFALHVDDSSECDAVSYTLNHLGRLICHLRVQENNDKYEAFLCPCNDLLSAVFHFKKDIPEPTHLSLLGDWFG